MSNTKKSAAPTRAMGAATLLLAAAVVLEVTGLQALSHGSGRWMTAAAADGATIYTEVDRAPAGMDTLAQAGY
ncbi:MAG: hypothetical protein ACJ8IK_28875 [Burkholderiaceae bacterium]|jgi:hypothetical protein